MLGLRPRRLFRRVLGFLSFIALACSVLGMDWESGPGFRRAAIRPTGAGPQLSLLAPDLTGLTFTNRLSETALAANQILEIGAGVALGDVDGDGLVDVYFCATEGSNRLFRNLGNWRFAEVTVAAQVACEGQSSTGCAFADLDGDGDLDLLVTGIGAGTRVFFNDGRGIFQEASGALTRQGGTTSLALADINGDGFLDLYVTHYHTRTVKDSPGVKVTVRDVGGQLEISPRGLFLPMYGKRGEVSLFERGEADELYLNDGKGGFRLLDWTGGTFLDAEGKPLAEAPKDWGLAVMFRDLNADGAPDIYVCNDFFYSPDSLWLNDGTGRFRMAPLPMLRHTSMSSMAVDFADINRDGFDDFFVLDMMSRDHRTRHRQRGSLTHVKTRSPTTDPLFRPEYPRNTLFLNRGDGTYAEIAALAGVEASEWSWSASFLDVDLDGYEDLLIANGTVRNANDADASGPGHLRYGKLETANLLFRNQGDLTFREVGVPWGFHLVGISHGMALGDLDNDGDLDVVINNLGTPAAVYRNDSGAGRVAVRLKGQAPNTQGIGARVTLLGGAVPSQSHEVLSGGRYLSCDDGLRIFATGTVRDAMTLEVLWPGGQRSVVKNVLANSIYEISQEPVPLSERSNLPGSPSSESALDAPGFPLDAERAESKEPVPRSPVGTRSGDSPAVSSQPLFENVSSWLRPAHQETDFDDWAFQPLLPEALGFGGPGVSWFDADGDGWEDLLVGGGRGSHQILFLNTRPGFKPMRRSEALTRDQTALLGWRDDAGARILAGFSNYEDAKTNGASVIEFHLEKPGQDQPLPDRLDSTGPLALGLLRDELALFVGGRCRPGRFPEPASSRLFRRVPAGAWVLDEESTRTLADVGLVSGAVWADLDADGVSELILACDWGPIRVFETKTGALVEKTGALGLDRFIGRWNGVATGDFDGDGRVEIVASNWGRNTRYERHRARPIRIYYGDWNDDGRTDLLEAYYESTLGAYVPFVTLDVMREVLPELVIRYPSFAAYSDASVEQILGEAMNRTQMIEANWFETAVFFWRDGRFVAHPLPIEAQFTVAFGLAVGDADGDGQEDIFLSQNFFALEPETPRHDAGQGLWLRGNGRGGFLPWNSRESGILLHGEQRGCALADFDHDGRLDLAVGQNRGPFGLFRNLRAAPGLRVHLHGPAENRDALGATLRLRFEHGWSPAKTVQAGSGYWSQSSATPLFGLPAPPLEIQVRWPGGRVSTHPVPAGAKEISVSFDPAWKGEP